MKQSVRCPFCGNGIGVVVTVRNTLVGTVHAAFDALHGIDTTTRHATTEPSRLVRLYCVAHDCDFYQEMVATRDPTTGYLTFDDYIWKACVAPLIGSTTPNKESSGAEHEFEILIKPSN